MPSYRNQPAFSLNQLVDELDEHVDSICGSDTDKPNSIADWLGIKGSFEKISTLRSEVTDPLRIKLTDPAGGEAFFSHQISPAVRKIWELTGHAALQMTLGDVQDFADKYELDFPMAWRFMLHFRTCEWVAANLKIEIFFRTELESKLQTALNDFFEEAVYFSYNTLGYMFRDPEYLKRSSQYLKERNARTNAVRPKGRKKGKTLPPDEIALKRDYEEICSVIAELKHSRVANRIANKKITKKEVAERVFRIDSNPRRKLDAVLKFFSVSFEDLVASSTNHTN